MVSVSVVFTIVSVVGTAKPAVVSTPGTVVVSAVSLSALPHAAITVIAANATAIVFLFVITLLPAMVERNTRCPNRRTEGQNLYPIGRLTADFTADFTAASQSFIGFFR